MNICYLNVIHRTLLFFVLATFTTSLQAEESEHDLIYVCNSKTSELLLVPTENAERAEQRNFDGVTEKIASFELIQYSPEDQNRNVFRTGSKTKKMQCGVFTISIRGGFLNGNPQGELGAIEVPLIDISIKGKYIVKKLSLGHCDSSLDRFSHSSSCPKDWSTEVYGYLFNGKPVVNLQHNYEESRRLP